jgi:hypothetical protein
MTNCEQLSKMESKIRTVVTAGTYEEATLLLCSYCKQLETELQSNSFQCNQTAEVMAHTNEFLDWIFRMASTARAHDAAELAELLLISQYQSSEANQFHSWRLEG